METATLFTYVVIDVLLQNGTLYGQSLIFSLALFFPSRVVYIEMTCYFKQNRNSSSLTPKLLNYYKAILFACEYPEYIDTLP